MKCFPRDNGDIRKPEQMQTPISFKKSSRDHSDLEKLQPGKSSDSISLLCLLSQMSEADLANQIYRLRSSDTETIVHAKAPIQTELFKVAMVAE
jgi:hypothetical protein